MKKNKINNIWSGDCFACDVAIRFMSFPGHQSPDLFKTKKYV